MTPHAPDRRPTALHRATAPRRSLPSNFTHQTMQRIEARRQAAERRNQRLAVVTAALAVAGALGFLGWTFGTDLLDSLKALPDSLKALRIPAPQINLSHLTLWRPVGLAFVLLIVLEWWLSHRRQKR